MNPLSKSYDGPLYYIVIALSALASVLANPDVLDLGSWVGPAGAVVAFLLMFLQQNTKIGDKRPA